MKINDVLTRHIAEDAASDIAAIQKAIADLQKQAATTPAMKASSEKAIGQLQSKLASLQQGSVNAAPAAGYKGSPAAQAIAKANNIPDANKIKAGQVIKVNGSDYTIKPGDTLDKIAAANKGGAAVPAASPARSDNVAQVDAATGNTSGMRFDPQTNKLVPDNAEAQPAAEPAAEPAPNGAAAAMASTSKAPAAEPAAPADTAAPADDLARMTQLAGAGKPAGGYGNFTGGQPSAAPAVTTRDGQPIKTGTGGTLTSRSDDELAWASKQPMGGTGQQYPGAGNWDPKTGRDLKAAAQGEKNWNAIKNFFGGKKPAAAEPAPVAPAEGTELSAIKRLSGL